MQGPKDLALVCFLKSLSGTWIGSRAVRSELAPIWGAVTAGRGLSYFMPENQPRGYVCKSTQLLATVDGEIGDRCFLVWLFVFVNSKITPQKNHNPWNKLVRSLFPLQNYERVGMLQEIHESTIK